MQSRTSAAQILAIVPARGGSKGLPGKNIRPLAGLPLIAHSIRFAQMCPEVGRCVVSTDSEEIAEVARRYGAEVPFMRPAELASDEAGIMPVIRHATVEVERLSGQKFSAILLLQVTNPVREREDLLRGIELLGSDPAADGVIAVSRPDFNPRYVCLEERDGYAAPAFSDKVYTRRQDVPEVFRISGSLYMWRRDYIMNADFTRVEKKIKMLEVPADRTIDIDFLRDIQVAEALIGAGLITLQWPTTSLPPK